MYIINGVRPLNCREFLDISQQRWISHSARFRNKNALDVYKYTRVCEYILSDEIESRQRNQTADEKCTIVSDLLPITLLLY